MTLMTQQCHFYFVCNCLGYCSIDSEKTEATYKRKSFLGDLLTAPDGKSMVITVENMAVDRHTQSLSGEPTLLMEDSKK